MAGLSAAFRLQEAGLKVTVFEKNPEVGGLTRSVSKQGYVMDLGALTLSPAYVETFALMQDANADDICVFVKPQLALVRDGKLEIFDLNKPIATGLSSKFLSTTGKLRLAKLMPTLAKCWNKCHFDHMDDLAQLDTETSEEFALRLLGQEVHDYLVDPIIRLNMFSATNRSSAVDFVWSLKIVANTELVQVKGGIGALATEVSKSLHDLRPNTAVTKVRLVDEQVVVEVEGEDRTFDGVVVALPPNQVRNVVPDAPKALKAFLEKTTSMPSVTVNIGVTKPPKTGASIILVPSRESADIIAVVLEHNKCEGRAPADKGLITLHLSASWVATQAGVDDHQLGLNALALAEPWLGDIDGQVDMVNVHRWQHVDHERYVGCYKDLAAIHDEMTNSRLTFAGYYSSAGIEGAVRSGKRCAQALTKTLLSKA